MHHYQSLPIIVLVLTFVFVPSFLFNRSVLFVVYFSVLLLLLLLLY